MNISKMLFLCVMIGFLSTAYSQTNSFDTDKFLRTIDLQKLLEKNKALNLIAQLSDPSASTSNVDDMDDFIGIANIDTGSIFTEFDRYQDILQQIRMPFPWIGVAEFKQHQIPAITLQQGFESVQSCMAQQGEPVSNTISRVVIYRTINSSHIVYDYLFTDKQLPWGTCQEVLYDPIGKNCEYGMIDNCHIDMSTVVAHVKN
jgi:hypothetical protein